MFKKISLTITASVCTSCIKLYTKKGLSPYSCDYALPCRDSSYIPAKSDSQPYRGSQFSQKDPLIPRNMGTQGGDPGSPFYRRFPFLHGTRFYTFPTKLPTALHVSICKHCGWADYVKQVFNSGLLANMSETNMLYLGNIATASFVLHVISKNHSSSVCCFYTSVNTEFPRLVYVHTRTLPINILSTPTHHKDHEQIQKLQTCHQCSLDSKGESFFLIHFRFTHTHSLVFQLRPSGCTRFHLGYLIKSKKTVMILDKLGTCILA